MKKPIPKFLGHIREGRVRVQNSWLYRKYLSQFKEGDAVYLSIRKARPTRTSKQPGEESNQNGYYWGVVIPILSDYFGYMPDEMHDALKYKFLRIGGTDQLPKIKSTTKLDTKEWEDLMEQIRIWALNDHGIKIPKPHETETEN